MHNQESKWKQRLRWKVESHKYSHDHQNNDLEKELAKENMVRIENELEKENYHELLKLLIARDYEKAFQYIEKC